MVGTNASTNRKHKFYNSKVQAISIGGVDCAKKFRSIRARFVDMGSQVKTQVDNGLSKLFGFWGHTIDVYDQAFFILKDSGIHDEEGKKKFNRPFHNSPEEVRAFFFFHYSAEVAYEDPWEQVRMGFKAEVGGFHDVNFSH